MRKVIFEIHIDIPNERLDTDLGAYSWDTINRSERTKIEYNKHADKLTANKIEYAEKIGADFLHFGRDEKYEKYLEMMWKKHPHLSEYLIINFYKHQLMYDLAEEYDEVLYVDFDVIFQTDESYFDAWNFDDGFHVWCIDYSEEASIFDYIQGKIHLRSMINKHFIAYAMLMEEYESLETPVINTGIMGASARWIKELDYPGNVDRMIKIIDWIRKDPDSMYSENLQQSFDWNNEPLMTYLIQTRNVPLIETNGQWNACVSETHEIKCAEEVKDYKVIHMINKRFDWVWP